MAVEPRFLLDTNICIYILDAARLALRARIEAAEVGSLVTSTIVLAEVLRGIAVDDDHTMTKLKALLMLAPPLPFDASAAQAYARLPFARGRFDRLIAAHALSLGLVIVTANPRDFVDVEGLAVQDWTLP
jgi:tRNA(fMet)-specific endonuclease VapC